MSRVCIIGLDGGTFTVIDYLIEQGRLPNFAALINKGSRATLLSSVPPITPAAWASFFTGTNPGKNGTVDFFKWQPGTYKLSPVNALTVKGSTLWSLATQYGKRVCVYNVPVTYPALPVNGILISGMDAPWLDEKAVYPSSYRDKLLASEPEFSFEPSIDFKYLVNNHPDPTGECIRLLEEHLQMEIRVVRKLLAEESWDLFVSVFRSPDAFQHLFWDSVEKVIMGGHGLGKDDSRRADAVFRCYETLDAELGALRERIGGDVSLILMSDHGFGLLEREVCLNRVLAHAGLLDFLPAGGKRSSYDYLVGKIQARLPKSTRQRIKKLIGRDDSDERWNLFVDALVADIDWSRTRLCSVGQFGCIFANIKGRDPLGTVADEKELQSVLDEAEAVFRELRDPEDGKPVVSRIYRREELYHGPLTPEMPDMVVVMRDYAYRGIYSTRYELSEESIIRRPRSEERRELAHSGTHRREGILVLLGPDVDHADLGSVDMVDVAPTVMSMLGLPLLEDYDGKAIAGHVGSTAARKNQAAEAPAGPTAEVRQVYTEEDEEEVRKRLEDLGYL